MVVWYKHNIPDWMDGTEGLDDGPYRAYHVVCQLIYLHEGPIALNEKGIAGRCKQHVLAFRHNLKVLLDLKKLTLADGRLDNNRASTELEHVANHRATSAKGGEGSAGVAKRSRGGRAEVDDRSAGDSSNNHLKNNDRATAALSETQHHKTREEETRREEIPVVVEAREGKSVFSDVDFDLTSRILKAQGLTEGDLSTVGTTYIAKKWTDQGWQPDLIVATIERVMAKRDKAPNNLRYFEQAIADAHTELARAVPAGSATGPPRQAKQSFADLAIELERKIHDSEPEPTPKFTVIDGRSGNIVRD